MTLLTLLFCSFAETWVAFKLPNCNNMLKFQELGWMALFHLRLKITSFLIWNRTQLLVVVFISRHVPFALYHYLSIVVFCSLKLWDFETVVGQSNVWLFHYTIEFVVAYSLLKSELVDSYSTSNSSLGWASLNYVWKESFHWAFLVGNFW